MSASYGSVSFDPIIVGPNWTAPDWDRGRADTSEAKVWDDAGAHWTTLVQVRGGAAWRLKVRASVAVASLTTLQGYLDGAERTLSGWPVPSGSGMTASWSDVLLVGIGPPEIVVTSAGATLAEMDLEFLRTP